jgi:malate dehydrogenase (oxaloacetate-decarboxylating)
MTSSHNFAKKALAEHKKLAGKIQTNSRVSIHSLDQLSTYYTPGVGAVSSLLAEKPNLLPEYTIASNTVAVISDGSAVLGLGNVGPEAALPVMEGKAMLFAQLAGLNAFPIVLRSQDPDEIIKTIVNVAPVFAAINLEDIAAPQCFTIESELQDKLSIPVVHDDQHATAIAVLAGLINALQVVGKEANKARVVIVGAGAAGNAVAKLLHEFGFADILVLDSKGILATNRTDLDSHKQELAKLTNKKNVSGDLASATKGSDVIIGLTTGGEILPSHIKSMSKDPIVFALANPNPEILPNAAKKAGAVIVATGRSDFENQINNVLVFPGLFKGLILSKQTQVNITTKISAAIALAGCVRHPTPNKIIPSVFDTKVVGAIVVGLGRS